MKKLSIKLAVAALLALPLLVAAETGAMAGGPFGHIRGGFTVAVVPPIPLPFPVAVSTCDPYGCGIREVRRSHRHERDHRYRPDWREHRRHWRDDVRDARREVREARRDRREARREFREDRREASREYREARRDRREDRRDDRRGYREQRRDQDCRINPTGPGR